MFEQFLKPIRTLHNISTSKIPICSFIDLALSIQSQVCEVFLKHLIAIIHSKFQQIKNFFFKYFKLRNFFKWLFYKNKSKNHEILVVK